MFKPLRVLGGWCLFSIAIASGCSSNEPSPTTYFDRTISPILTNSCSRANTGAACHVSTPKGNAFGNLDTSSYQELIKRRDLLAEYGPYGKSAFLTKAVPPTELEVQTFTGAKSVITTDIRHAGGSILEPGGSAYQILSKWIANGATENNGGPPPSRLIRTDCNPTVPREKGFDPTKDPAKKDFGTFRDRVNPLLRDSEKGCGAGNCHGTQANELYLTCGESPEQVRWNYYAAESYLAKRPEESELLRRPVGPAQGGSFHEGGVIFENLQAEGYVALSDWAKEHGPLVYDNSDPSFSFFAERVQAVFVKKGCMMLQCHSASMFHDFRLRGGSGGSFSLSASKKNYELSLSQLAIEHEDATASRLVQKNLYRPDLFEGGHGVFHRGGPLLEDFGRQPATKAACDAANPPYDYNKGNLDQIPAFCIIQEWLTRERAARKSAPLSAIVYVKRNVPQGANRLQDFDIYAPGSELHVAQVGTDLALGTDEAVNAKCGLTQAAADIRRPNVSWDGKRVAFGARQSAQEPMAVYELDIAAGTCQKHPGINAGAPSENGLLVHNFDPAYSPPNDQGVDSIVFASTRGNVDATAVDYRGPQRTPADPAKPNSNLYVFEKTPDGASTRVRQLTFLLNTERQPSFMRDGRVIFVAEKRAPKFYQLALRRINLDGGDYHPLFAQRGSIGFLQSVSPVELANKNFVGIFSNPGVPHQVGQLGVMNRSIGLDFLSKKPEDYVIDASVIDPAAPASPERSFFVQSLSFPDGAASGQPGRAGTGVYASPSPLPDGRVLVSYGAAGDPAQFGGDLDLFVMDPVTGAKTKILGDATSQEIDAVAVYGRVSTGVFRSSFDEPNGHTEIREGKKEADVTILSVPVLASLMFQNTPTGRLIESDLQAFDLIEDMPPPLEVTTIDQGGSNVVTDAYGKVYVRRRLLGRVPIAPDGSSHFQVPGGLPLLLKLPETVASRDKKLPRIQREQIVFSPGEYAHQSFRPDLFNGLCAGCHGSVSGRGTDSALNADVLTQASRVEAKSAAPIMLNIPVSQRGKVEGPTGE